ncbi:MAG: SufD family Fe-S cluster assembly protein [Fibrobacter sp.]|jgi:Fe-S cluster assembly protein SufD|nr:SufD family Fe-S cluster assembly protein [Fibrobacter sp.]
MNRSIYLDSRSLTGNKYEFVIEENNSLELILDETENISGSYEFFFVLKKNADAHILEVNASQGKIDKKIQVKLEGEHALFEYRSASLNTASAAHRTELRIFHEVPNAESKQLVRHVLSGEAFVYYDGTVEVGKHCSGTKSSQRIDTLLLSEDAKISVKPVLKIYHDDVECSHGNTCGELDPEALFYLESRGIPKTESKRILTDSFIRELILEHPDSPHRRTLLQKVFP